jgi:hypothetical protein
VKNGFRVLVAILTLVPLVLPGAAGASSPSGSEGKSKVRARLVADAADVGPGGTLHLGVVFDIDPGWHIYWRNPGGAGLATEVLWELPEGLEAGDLGWPLPIAFDQSEGIPGYGYQGTVMLASEIHSDVAVDFAAEIGAAVSWLACKDVCVLGSAELAGALGDLAESSEGFQRWQRDLPRSVDPGKPPFSVTTTGGLGEGRLTLWVRWPEAPGQVEWFPDPSEGLKVEVLGVRTRAALTRIDVAVQQINGDATGPPRLDSVVVVTDARRRRGWKLDVDLENDKP